MKFNKLLVSATSALFIIGCGGGNTSVKTNLSLEYLKNSTLNMNIQLSNGSLLNRVESFTNNTYSMSHLGQGVFSCQLSKTTNRDFRCYYIPTDSSLIKEGYDISINTETNQVSGDFAYTQNVLSFEEQVSNKEFHGIISGEIIK